MTTIYNIAEDEILSESRPKINTNFSNLNSAKIESLNDLNITASSTEINYCRGVTANIQTQIDGKLAAMTGEIKMVAFGEGSIPTGWLICDGAAVSRTTYATLYAAIGDTYGAGNGTTTFNIPDLRGRAPVGIDSMGQGAANVVTATEADTLGDTYGAETHTLTVDEMPAHTHGLPSDGGAGSDETLQSGNLTGAYTNENSASTGGGSAHNNIQPSIFLNFIIKT